MIRYATITVVLALLLPGFKTDELLDVEFGPFLHTHEDCEYILPVSSNVRGGTAVSNAVPYMVSLQKSIDSEQKWFMHTCAGTFIDEGIILTAAHCIWEEGRFDFRQEPKGYQGQVKEELKAAIAPLCRHDQGKGRVKIYDYYINPEYDAGQVWQGSDIAILVLGQDFYNLNYQTQFVQVDPIAASGLSNLQVYGWGAVNKEDQALFSTTILPLQQAQLRHTSVSECMESGKFTNLNDNDFVCATFIGGDITGVQDTCAGDSGGPLFVSDPNSEYAVHQIGLPNQDNRSLVNVIVRFFKQNILLVTLVLFGIIQIRISHRIISVKKQSSLIASATMSTHVESAIWAPQLQNVIRLDLLKKLEELTLENFLTADKYDSLRHCCGDNEPDVKKVLDAVSVQQWQGIEDYSEQWLTILDAAVVRQTILREGIMWALDNLDHGFNKFEKALIYHSAIIGGWYDKWFGKWIREHEGSQRSKQLAEDDKNGKIPKEFYNNYTVITIDEQGYYSQLAYGEFYKDEIKAITQAMQACIDELNSIQSEIQESALPQYVTFFQTYIQCLEETDIEKLEQLWTQLDIDWMKIKYWIQIVHDIEYGYSEPLRCKVCPQFSIRLLDEQFTNENKKIEEIHALMVDYFAKRPSQMAQDGLQSLRQTTAGIYYLPFLCADNLHFRFSGQSIPNRTEVRNMHGSKIYFDYVAAYQREQLAKDLARAILKNKELAEDIDTLETIVYQIAPHEVGHAIYSLHNITNLKSTTQSLLEEPRAELTTLHTLKLMVEAGLITPEQMMKQLCSFMLQDLRRFAMFNSSSIRPYTISAMSCYDSARQNGVIELDAQKMFMRKGEGMEKRNRSCLRKSQMLRMQTMFRRSRTSLRRWKVANKVKQFNFWWISCLINVCKIQNLKNENGRRKAFWISLVCMC
eukprot:TRINITY_DN49_c0_g1_i1.p1 TRINITY_DN49_c0_g1~~TRINITY_DN49_c0_g1_i1.p1  ORF type:complete len:916 (-),score=51.99 TRINITY_DN49_c0_g1_i1:206-2953(-)